MIRLNAEKYAGIHMALIAYAISGPTGIGKTDIALRLAQILNGELLSIDSVQVFKFLSIGANKYQVKHDEPYQHLVDQISPCQEFNSNMFFDSLIVNMKDIYEKKKIPILVGGTAFYYDWIFTGRPSIPEIPKSVRDFVTSVLDKDKWHFNIQNLQALSYEKPPSINTNDIYRLQRSLEIFLFTGRSRDSFPRIKNEFLSSIKWFPVYLNSSRAALYRVVDQRCEEMILEGLIEETVDLMKNGLIVQNTSPARAIGYNETIRFISEYVGSFRFEAKVRIFQKYLEEFQASTRELIRKQDSWFSRKLHNFLCIYKHMGVADENQKIADRLSNISTRDDSGWDEIKSSSDILKAKRDNRSLRQYKTCQKIFDNQLSVIQYLEKLDEYLVNNNCYGAIDLFKTS